MPLIIAPENYERWLDAAVDEVVDLFAPYPADAMAFYPVSTRVNAVRNDDATLIEPVTESAPAPSDDAAPDNPDDTAEPIPEQASLF
jgi:hypothetical protein